MTAKTTTKADSTFAAALARVQPALTAWRQRRKHRESIPEPLWRAMVRLARRYGLSPVAQVLRVNYTALSRCLTRRRSPGVCASSKLTGCNDARLPSMGVGGEGRHSGARTGRAWAHGVSGPRGGL